MRRREFIELIGATALSFPRQGYIQTNTGLPLVSLAWSCSIDELLNLPT
jgi:hypothetical protein